MLWLQVHLPDGGRADGGLKRRGQVRLRAHSLPVAQFGSFPFPRWGWVIVIAMFPPVCCAGIAAPP